MKYPSKLASLLVVAVLSVAGLSAVTTAYGGSERGHHGWADHGKKKMCDRGGKHGKHWKHGQKRLVEKLNIMETKIGIRANQLDAWRDFTDALLATMSPPWKTGMGPGKMQPDEDAAPFSLAERFADRAIERAKSAEALKAAIENLRTTLTPEQLEKVKAIEAKLRARMMRHHAGSHHKMMKMKGPHGGPPEAKPDAGPDDTPDDADDPDDDNAE